MLVVGLRNEEKTITSVAEIISGESIGHDDGDDDEAVIVQERLDTDVVGELQRVSTTIRDISRFSRLIGPLLRMVGRSGANKR